MSDPGSNEIKLLAVASGGGHWEELMLLRPSLDVFDPIYATTDAELATRDGIRRIHVLPDSNRNQPLKALHCAWAAFVLVRKLRPDFIITTGALPGLFCIMAGRTVGAKTIWIDSIANSDKPSMSGSCAKLFATLRLTQWQHLARPSGLDYAGAVL